MYLHVHTCQGFQIYLVKQTILDYLWPPLAFNIQFYAGN